MFLTRTAFKKKNAGRVQKKECRATHMVVGRTVSSVRSSNIAMSWHVLGAIAPGLARVHAIFVVVKETARAAQSEDSFSRSANQV